MSLWIDGGEIVSLLQRFYDNGAGRVPTNRAGQLRTKLGIITEYFAVSPVDSNTFHSHLHASADELRHELLAKFSGHMARRTMSTISTTLHASQDAEEQRRLTWKQNSCTEMIMSPSFLLRASADSRECVASLSYSLLIWRNKSLTLTSDDLSVWYMLSIVRVQALEKEHQWSLAVLFQVCY